jgi:hypothetical protein
MNDRTASPPFRDRTCSQIAREHVHPRQEHAGTGCGVFIILQKRDKAGMTGGTPWIVPYEENADSRDILGFCISLKGELIGFCKFLDVRPALFVNS